MNTPLYSVGRVNTKRWTVLKDGVLLMDYVNTREDATEMVRVLTAEVTLALASIPVPPPVEPPVEPPPPPPPPPVVTRTPAYTILGPMLSAATISTLGSVPQKWLADFVKWEATHWTATGADWVQGDYYDRAEIDYAMWRTTGNATYLDHGTAMALDYRDKYLVPSWSQGGPSAHWAMTKGIALHHAITGDEESRRQVGLIADSFTSPYYFDRLATGAIDGRIKARTLESFILARGINAPSSGTPGGVGGGQNWDANAREAITRILAGQLPDGTYRSTWDQDFALDGSGPIIRAFMEGLINDTLVDYFFAVERDPRILPAVKRNIDALWDLVWVEADGAFKYNSKPCVGEPGSTLSGAPDLNGLIVEGFGFVYAMTGDATYKARGDKVFAGGVAGAYLYGQKQFNQAYTASYNYLALTNPELDTVTGDRATDWLK